jgi:hypothetical protein
MLRMLVLALLVALPSSAQFSGRLTGLVLDGSGAPVPGATVELSLVDGAKPLLTVRTSTNGVYHFTAVRPADYDLSVAATGFMKATVRGIAVDAARETSVPDIHLELPAVQQALEVTAEVQGVETANAEISGTISTKEIRRLPILDRDPLGVLQTQPGVVYNGNSLTVINGLRTSYSSVTLDGINIQDNYLRDNALDYTPNKLLLGQVRQMTLVSSNGSSASYGGATETAFSTPSGTNEPHGEVFWYNRNSFLSANDWFNNQSGTERPRLNQNQLGFSLGGPLRKDKLFFYANYEAVRAHQQEPVDSLILTSRARAGYFTYNFNGATREVNLLALRNLSGVDPGMQAVLDRVPLPDRINNGDVGDGRNYSGYRFNQRSNETRDNITGKIDYNVSLRHAITASYLLNRQNSDRPDSENDFSVIPKVYNPAHSNLISASWRWTPAASLTNESRAGFNLTAGHFETSEKFGKYLLTGTLFSNPVNEFQAQGRDTNTYVFSDDAAWQHGRHYVQFGFRAQMVRVRTYDEADTIPIYTLGMTSNPLALTRAQLQGASTRDLTTANSLLATLGGFVEGYDQAFNITSRGSGYVPGAPYLRNLRFGDYPVYVQDKWRIARRLTLTLGLRWEIPGVADERDSLALMPLLKGSLRDTLLSDATLDWVGSSVGRPWYRRSWNNFSPNIGFAWDVSGNGRTALRGGYSISRVNDQELAAPENMLFANPAIQGRSADIGINQRVSTGLSPIPVPPFQVPLRVSDEYALNPFNTVGIIDPNLKRPYVQQYSFGIQHDFRGTLFEARYVGNHAVGAYRAFDYNQVQIVENGFLADFQRARKNGYLAKNRTGVFNPVFDPGIAGSEPLTVFPLLATGGDFRGADVLYYLQSGEAGELANYYQTNGINGTVNFYRNPNALGADVIANYSHSTYNSLQVEVRRRPGRGLSMSGNYTFSKVLSDADGDAPTRFQAFLDVDNPKLERGRANFDLNHMIKANGYYELPFGRGGRMKNPVLGVVLGGWTVGSTMVWQSGAPFSILSGRGTRNREARSYYNTATTALTMSQLSDVVKFQMTGSGPMMVAATAINHKDTTGVNADGDAAFQGQVFFNPDAGALGTLQRRQFSGPWTFNLDCSLLRNFRVSENGAVELRGDAFNVLNHATFWPGDQNINSNAFGVIGSALFAPRIMQFGLYYRF